MNIRLTASFQGQPG